MSGQRAFGRSTPHLRSLIILLMLILLASSLMTALSAPSSRAMEGSIGLASPTDYQCSISSAAPGSSAGGPPTYLEAMRFFVHNKGQFDDAIKFVATTEFGKVAFYDSKVQYILEGNKLGASDGHETITLTFPGSEGVAPRGIFLLAHSTNYLIGEPSDWVVGAENYQAVVYHDIWPSIDLTYKFDEKGLKYEFSIDPFVGEDLIKVRVEGASISCEKSVLSLKASSGCLVDSGLVAMEDGTGRCLPSRFLCSGDIFSFLVTGRDMTKSLLIDPLVFSTYIGGREDDLCNGVAVDASGNVYATGYTDSNNFPTSSPYQSSIAGSTDAFILKMNSAGSSLVYSTYIGGGDYDFGLGIAVDGSGNAYVAGHTSSTNFPLVNPIQSNNGGSIDAFVLKLNSAGNSLVYSTYIGGSGDDDGYGIAVDGSGNAYVTGFTASSNFPTSNPFQRAFGGANDAFALKLSSTGSTLLYSTYLGGSGDDDGFGIAVDGSGSAYVTGYAESTNFPTSSPFQAANAGTNDAFVLKLNPSGSALVYSTYMGGSGYDYACDIALDSGGNAYVTGYTFSNNFPTLNPYQASRAGGGDDFIFKLNAAGSALVYSTYIGGTGDDFSLGISVDASGNAYACGHSVSTNFPTPNAYQPTNAGGTDVTLLELSSAGSLVYSTYIGGTGDDTGVAIAVQGTGNAYAAGSTSSTNFPRASAFQGSNAGGSDGFILKFSFSSAPTAPLDLTAAPSNGKVTLSWKAPSFNGNSPITSYRVYRGTMADGETLFVTLGNVLTYDNTGLTNGQTYYYKVSAVNSLGEGSKSTEVSATPATVPSAPLSLLATTGNGQVVLAWTAPADSGGQAIAGYKLFRGITLGGETLLTTLGTVLTWTDASLTNGQTYYYKVSAFNSIGDGPQSNEASGTPATIPGAPQGLNAARGNAQVLLSWSAPASNGGATISGYRVYRGNAPNGEAFLTALGNVLTYTDAGLTNGQTYYYKVSAVNSVGEGAQSSEASATPATVPSAPQSLAATRGNAQTVLSWTAPSSNGGSTITGYKVYRGSTPGGEVFLASLGDTFSYTDAGLTNGQTYYYKVSAVNLVGEGALSNEASATPATLPSAPRALTASSGNAQSVLSWSAPSSNGGATVTNYKVYRGGSPGGETLLITLGNVLTYTDTSLTNGQTYYYKVSAANSVGEGAMSNETSASPATVPSPPQNLVVTPGNAQASLSWQAPTSNGGATVTNYRVYRGTASGSETLLTTLGSVLTFSDSALTNGQTYYYKIGAVNRVGESPLSSEASGTPSTVPTVPQNLVAAAGNMQVTLSWVAPLDNGGQSITSYKVYRGTSSGGESLFTSLGNVQAYTDTSLTNGQTYYYKVSAANSVGEGATSNEAYATPATIPSAPQNLQAAAGNAQTTLTWTAPSTNGGSPVTGYRIYRGTSTGGESLLTSLGNVLTYTNTGLTNGQTYFYKVSAVNSVGEGPPSNEASALPSTVPGAPTGLSATPGNAQVALAWSAPVENGGQAVTGYRLYRGTAPGGETTLATLGSVLSYTDSSLTNGQIYYYKVSAINPVGEGAKSNEASATPASPPSAPQGLVAVRGNAQAALSWSAPGNNGGAAITGYKVYRGTAPGGEALLTTLGNVLTYTNVGLVNGQTYYFKVSAVNSAGEGQQSNEASVTPATTPSAPTISSASAGNAQVALAWTAPSSDGGAAITSYRVYRGTAPGGEAFLTSLAGVLNFTDTGLTNGQAYFYRISAVNAVGEGAQSSEASATPATVPAAPALTSAVPGNSQVTLSWSAPPDDGGNAIIGYRIYRGTAPGGEVLLATQGNVLTFINTGLTNGQTYYYKVSALNGIGEGARSNEISASPVTVPGAPTGLVAVAGNAQVSLAWTAPLDNGGRQVVNYRVYRGTSPGQEALLASLGSVLAYTDSPLTNGQAYYYKVSAVNSVGEGSQSVEASAVPATVPSAPLSLIAAPGNSQMALSWLAPTSDGGLSITGYKVYRGTSPGGEVLLVSLGNVLSYTNTGLTNGQTYYYKVSAVNPVGEGAKSIEASAAPATVPGSPQNLLVSAGDGQVVLTWAAPIDNGGRPITSYKLYRGTAPGGEALLSTLGNVLTYTDTSLVNGQTYYYQVSAVSSIGEGPRSSEASAVPATAPSAPQALLATRGNAQIVLTWSAPVDNGGQPISSYEVYRGTASGAETLLATLGNVLTYTNIGLTNGQAYYYKVSAVNSRGEGLLSSEASAVPATTPTSPQNLLAVAGNAQAVLSWSAPSNNGGASITAYKIYRGTAPGGEVLLVTLGNVLTYTSTGLTNGQTYYYKVGAVNPVGEGAQSNEANATPVTVPGAPQGLAASPGNAQVVLTWSAPASNGGSSITNYKVYRGIAPGAETLLLTLGNVLTYTDTGLTNGQTYYYKVSAVSPVGEGAQTNEVSAKPLGPPTSPQNLQARPGSAYVNLTWQAPTSDGGSPITNYQVWRGIASGQESLLASSGTRPWYNDTGLTNGQTYYYKVRAVNSQGTGPESTESSATPSQVVVAPSAPQGLTAARGNSQITLNWSAPANNGGSSITSYKIYRGMTSGGEALLNTLGVVLTYTDTGLTNGQTYYYKVSAINSAGEGPRSSEASATPATVPAAPSLASATAASAQIVLTWSAPTDDGHSPITNYKVYRGASSGGEAWIATVGNALTYADTGLANGQTYYYKVSAANSLGEGPLSNELSAKPVGPPSAPQDLQASASNAQVTLTWSAPADNGGSAITGYRIFRATTPGGESLLATLGNVLTYTNAGLANGQTYYYKVSASNAVGDGAQSNEVYATPSTVPGAPTNLAATPGNAQVSLTWSPPLDNGGQVITNYRVQRGTTSGGESLLATLGNVLAFTDTSLTNGQAYYYKVSAVSSVGEGPQSIEVTATPASLPSSPRGLAATSGNGQVSLTWSAPLDDGGRAISNYKLYRGTAPGGEALLTTIGNVLGYIDPSLTNGQTYYYKVSAVTSVGEGPPSEEAYATPGSAPSAPAILSIAPGNGIVDLAWSAPLDDGGSAILHYRVYRGTAPGGEIYLTTLGNVHNYTDPGLTNGQAYFYQVSAMNSVGEGPRSFEANAVPVMVPTVPRDLQAAAGDNEVALSWQAPSDDGGNPVTGYKVYRGTMPGGETLLVVLGAVLNHTDAGLANGETYYYKVSAFNSVGEGPRSAEASATPATLPSSPLRLSATAGNRQVLLSWSAPADNGGQAIVGYQVYRGNAMGNEAILASLGVVLSYNDSGLTNGLTYYYKVSALNSVGEGPGSAEASATPASVPGPPTLLSSSPGDGKATLTWSAPPDDGGSHISNYRIYRRTTSPDSLIATLGESLNFTDSGLTNGVTYYYRVSAVSSIGEGARSNELGVTPVQAPTPPSSPRNLRGVGDYAQATLDWEAPSNDGGSQITNYNVYRRSTGNQTLLATLGNVLQYVDSGLTNGETYYYSVSAVNIIGEGPLSNEVSVMPPTHPSEPRGLLAEAGDRQVVLTWSAPSYDGGGSITGYKVYRGNSSGGGSLLASLGDVLTYADANLRNGQTYFYQVSALSSAGEGPRSDEVSATPSTVPDAPMLISATPGNTSAALVWTAPSSDGGAAITSYKVYRGTASGEEVPLATVGDVLAFNDAGLTNGQTYYYQVAAVNPLGEGLRSNEAPVTPLTVPAAPKLNSAITTSSEVVLGWSAPSDDGGSGITGYIVYRGNSSGGEALLIVLGPVLSYDDIGLANGQTYYYKVSAVNSVGEGGASNELQATPIGPPTAPRSIQASPGDEFVNLSWQPPVSDGGSAIVSYWVVRRAAPEGETFYVDVGLVRWYNDTGLTNGHTYYYSVGADNALGPGATSEISATPSPTPTAPSPPQGLSATSGDSSATLTWVAPSSDGGAPITNYRVYRGTSPGGEALLASLGNVLTYRNVGLTNGQIYYYKVSAVNSAGESAYSEEISTRPLWVPTPPRDLRASAGNVQVALSWSAPSSDGGSSITTYMVYRGTASGGEAFIASLGGVLSYIDTGLNNGQTYYYKVSASNSLGESERSNEASARPGATTLAPSPPRDLSCAAGSTYVVLTWDVPLDDGGAPISGYSVYRGDSSGGEILLATLGDAITYNDTGLINGHDYFYQVSATNSVGEGARSAEQAAMPKGPPSVPTDLQAVPGDVSVRLSWAAPSSDGGGTIVGYKIYRSIGSGEATLLASLGIQLSYTDTGLTNGQDYHYKVSAIGSAGEGMPTGEVTATPAATSQGGGDMTLIIAIVAVVAIGGIAGAMLYMRRRK